MIVVATIAAIIMARQPHVAAPRHTKAPADSTRITSSADGIDHPATVDRSKERRMDCTKSSRQRAATSMRNSQANPAGEPASTTAAGPPSESYATSSPSTSSGEPATSITRVSPRASGSSFSRSPIPVSVSHAIPGRAANTTIDEPYLTPQPAAWIDLDLPKSMLGQGFDEHVVALAQDVITQTSDPLEPDETSPSSGRSEESQPSDNAVVDSGSASATLHPNWANAVAESDFRFRQFYGGHVWMMHHIQSHHLAAGNLPGEP